MNSYLYLLDEWWYIIILICVMVVSGIVKQNNLLTPIYSFLLTYIKNKKLLLLLLSFVGGVLPIPGRVIISAGLLDTIAPINPSKRAKYGIVDFLATHHYYLWSPIEKTILIPMAVLKISYIGVLAYTWPLLVVSLLFLMAYIWTLDSNDISPQIYNEYTLDKTQRTSRIKDWIKFIKWETVFILLCILVIGNYVKHSDLEIKVYIESISHLSSFLWLSVISFLGSFILGSSSKSAGITSLLTSILGIHFFTYLFAIEFAGYLLSPCHKCVTIGMRYFQTPIKQYYFVILLWCLLLVVTGIITLLV